MNELTPLADRTTALRWVKQSDQCTTSTPGGKYSGALAGGQRKNEEYGVRNLGG